MRQRTVAGVREHCKKVTACVLTPLILSMASACATSARAPLLQQERAGITTPETRHRADLIYNLLAGEFALRRGDIAAAFDHYRKAALLTDDSAVLRSAFRLGLDSKDYSRALTLGERWLALNPDDLEIKQLLAVVYVMDRRFEDAMEILQDVIGRDDIDESRILGTLSATLMSEMPEEANARMKEMAERFTGSAQAQYAYALFLADTGDYEGVVKFAEKASRIDAEFANAYLLRGWGLIVSGQIERGLEVAMTAVAKAPDDVQVQGNYARLLLESGRSEEALRQFRLIHAGNPHNPDILQAIGVLSLQAGDFDTAEAFFDRLKSFPGRSVEASYYHGRIAEERGELQKALTIYRSIPSGEFFRQAQFSIAEVYQKLDEPEESIAQLEKARLLATGAQEQVAFYLEQGKILSRYERYAEAMEIYTQAIEQHGALNRLLYARGFAAAELGLLGRFEDDMLRILQDDPDNADVLNALGYLFAENNIRLGEAKAYLLRANALAPDDPAILDSLGWVEFRLDNIEAAETLIRRALARLRHPDVLGHLVEILCTRQRMEKARELLQKALEEFPDDKYLHSLHEACPR